MSPVLSTSPLTIDAVAIESSSLHKVAYHHQPATLQIEFRDGTIYQYLGVPAQAYRDLLQADSKGAHFNRHIRNVFPHVMLRAAVPIRPTGTPKTDVSDGQRGGVTQSRGH